jgi:hypothetical protein
MTMAVMHPIIVWLSCAIAGFLISTALAQTTNYTSIEVTAGKPVQLSYHASAGKNCTPAPPPTVHVTQAPKAGALVVRKAVLTTDKVAGCPKLKTPVQVVFYEARADYAGPDHVSYEATDSNGAVASYDVTITVKPAPAPSTPPAQGGTKL